MPSVNIPLAVVSIAKLWPVLAVVSVVSLVVAWLLPTGTNPVAKHHIKVNEPWRSDNEFTFENRTLPLIKCLTCSRIACICKIRRERDTYCFDCMGPFPCVLHNELPPVDKKYLED